MEAIFRSYGKDLLVILSTLGVFALVSYVYMVLKPTVILPANTKVSTCPTRWTYDPDTKICTPQYPTKCLPFNPDRYNNREKCDIANSCETGWKGLCTT